MMPRYFFNYRANGVLERDTEGSDLPTAEAAIREAELGAREVASQKVRAGEAIRSECFELTNADGVVIKAIPLRSVVIIEAEDA
jgi:hypothetical protein